MGEPERDFSIRFAVFELDTRSGELRKAGSRVKLQDQPLKVLTALLEQPGEVVTREELKRRIWPEDSFGDFDHAVNVAVAKLRTALGDSADVPRFVETLPRRGYRFIFPVTPPREAESGATSVAAETKEPVNKSSRLRWAATASIVVFGLAMGGWWVRSRRAHPLTDKDTIVLADFTNTTGDSVFDGTLRQGLSVQMEQSPFLSLVSEQQIQQTLQMMGQKPDAKLTPEISREVCQRTGSAAVIEGSIAQIGTQYLLTVKAVKCASGESLASTEAQASDKNNVLDALGKTASEIRNKLGESLSTLQKFDTPLQQATTPSLEALQAFTLGAKNLGENDSAAAVLFLQRAINLDPNFALAYVLLGACYSNLGETRLAAETTTRAYELRDRVSEEEKLIIDTFYQSDVTGDLEKNRQDCEIWAQTYPRDATPRDQLGVTYVIVGQYDKAIAEFREAVRLGPIALRYSNLVYGYLKLHRLEEARATLEEARTKRIDSSGLHTVIYILAFLGRDAAGMKQQVDWSVGKSGVEDTFLAYEATTAAYSGQLSNARVFSSRAVASAGRAEEPETAANYEADAALREALFGNMAEARHRIDSAFRLSIGRDVQYGVALALALIGDAARAEQLADDLGKRFPQDTVVQFNYLPTLRAKLALSRSDSSKAIEALQAATPYELGDVGNRSLYPVYVRGEAYLAAHRGGEAASEFQKIIDHRGIVWNGPIGALAHLQIARAYAMQGDTAKAKAAYQDFLTLWKDADPDIPIFIAAKAEYAKLQ